MRICGGIVLLSVVVCFGGCKTVKDEPGGHWYNADKPLTTAVHDCRQCVQEARFQAGTGSLGPDAQTLFTDCMHARGYRRVSEESLDPEVQKTRVPAVDGSEPVAGQKSGQ